MPFFIIDATLRFNQSDLLQSNEWKSFISLFHVSFIYNVLCMSEWQKNGAKRMISIADCWIQWHSNTAQKVIDLQTVYFCHSFSSSKMWQWNWRWQRFWRNNNTKWQMIYIFGMHAFVENDWNWWLNRFIWELWILITSKFVKTDRKLAKMN